jgi:hypothetical protein
MWEDMGDGLHNDNQFTREELWRATIEDTTPAMISDS